MEKVWKNGKGLEEWGRLGRMEKDWKDGEGLDGLVRVGRMEKGLEGRRRF